MASNVPKSYLQKWKVFNEWINNIQLNLQIRYLVKFGEEFYEPIYQFLTSYDPIPRIYSPNGLEYLPAGNRAHEMSDMVSV